MSNFTTNQLKAINEPIDKNILVSAGAGSGKTTVLTERIIQKEFKKIANKKDPNGASLDEMIILTFTNAASENMRKKIKKALLNEYKKTNNKTFLDEANYIDQANISTFDSFTARLFTKYAYKLNISGEINIIEENALLFTYVAIFKDVFKKYYDNKYFLELLDRYTLKSEDELVGVFVDLYSKKITNLVHPIDDFNYYYNNYELFYVDFEQNLISIIDNIKCEIIGLVDNSVLNNECKTKLEQIIEPLKKATSFDELCEAIRNFDVPKRVGIFKNNPIYDIINEKLKSLQKEAISIMPTSTLNNLRNEYFDNKNYIEVIYSILTDFINLYNAHIRMTNVYTYNDIALMVIEILENNPDVLNEIKDNTKEILVDEYQDTSNIQEALISLISKNNVFMVGDVKQSIYRFRSANPAIFRDKFDSYGSNPSKGTRIDLLENFRSSNEVIEDINLFFNSLMTKDYGNIDYAASHNLVCGNKVLKTKGSGIEYYNVLPLNDDDKKESINDRRERVFKDVLADINYRIENETINYLYIDKENNIEEIRQRKPEFKDFAILSRGKTSHKKYCDIAKSYNMPIICETAEAFIRNDDMYALTAILKLINNKNDTLSYYSILRSFLFERNDDYLLNLRINNETDSELDNLIDDLRYIKNSVNIYDLITKIYESFNFYKKISKLSDPVGAEKRLIQMVLLAKNEAEYGTTFDRFLEYLDTFNVVRKNKELDLEIKVTDVRDENSISLMTIHKSKGLEYPYIYLIETNADIGKMDKSPIMFDEFFGVIMDNINSFYQLIVNKHKLEQKYEDMRLLYVALTRAMQKVIIFGNTLEVGDETIYSPSISLDEKIKFKTVDDVLKAVTQQVYSEGLKELKPIKANNNSESKKLAFKEIKPFDIKENGARPSINQTKLLDNDEIKNIEYGIHIHDLLRYTDFNNPDYSNISSLDMERIENFINNVVKNNKIVKDDIINFYKEYELNCGGVIGSIDLIIETIDQYIIIDYKTKAIDKPGYIRQVNVYMNALKNLTKDSKEIKGYLYSIIDELIEEVKFTPIGN